MTVEMIAEFIENNWLPIVIAFLVGQFVGWLIGAAPWANEDDPDEPSSGKRFAGKAARAQDDVKALEEDIAAVRAQIEQPGGGVEAVASELDELDAAIKRANGRLKLIMRSIDQNHSE